VPPHAKKIPNESVHRQEWLRVSCGFEPPRLSLAWAGWLMRNFGSIVFVLPTAVNNTRHHAFVGRRVAAKLVRDQTPWRTALPFQQLTEEALIVGRTQEMMSQAASVLPQPRSWPEGCDCAVTSIPEPGQERAGPADKTRRRGGYTIGTPRGQCRQVVASHSRVQTARCRRPRWPGRS
jgi:hypothetical protein